jgi:hypothetical protein
VFVAGIEHSFVTKVVVTNQMFFFSADRTGMGHFIPLTDTFYIIFFDGVPYILIGWNSLPDRMDIKVDRLFLLLPRKRASLKAQRPGRK